MSCPTAECGARRHDIFIESVGDGEADVDYPAFVDAQRRCPREDVGAGVHSRVVSSLTRTSLTRSRAIRWRSTMSSVSADPLGLTVASVGTAVTPCPGGAYGSQRDAR